MNIAQLGSAISILVKAFNQKAQTTVATPPRQTHLNAPSSTGIFAVSLGKYNFDQNHWDNGLSFGRQIQFGLDMGYVQAGSSRSDSSVKTKHTIKRHGHPKNVLSCNMH